MTDDPSAPAPDFDPEMLETIKQGALRIVKLHPLDYKAAISLRMKLYRLRKRLIRTNHEVAPSARAITIKLLPLDGSFALIVCPSNLDYDVAFTNAGIKSDQPPPLD